MQQLAESKDPSSPNKILLDLWKRPSVTVTTILPAVPVNTLEVVNMTLLDAGQMVVVSSEAIDVDVAEGEQGTLRTNNLPVCLSPPGDTATTVQQFAFNIRHLS